tara:strand:+ start:624 stop:1001 length:378 start_codon:yes stop_codon:yes gene_type:complete
MSKNKSSKKLDAVKAVAQGLSHTEPPMPEGKATGRYIGGEGVMSGQNVIFAENGEDGMELTDAMIAVLWNANWPLRKITYTAKHVVGARRDYNKGLHGQKPAIAPEVKIGQWVENKETHARTYKA